MTDRIVTDDVIAAVRVLKDDPGDELQIWGSRRLLPDDVSAGAGLLALRPDVTAGWPEGLGLAVPQKDGRPAMRFRGLGVTRCPSVSVFAVICWRHGRRDGDGGVADRQV